MLITLHALVIALAAVAGVLLVAFVVTVSLLVAHIKRRERELADGATNHTRADEHDYQELQVWFEPFAVYYYLFCKRYRRQVVT
jgi:hypothetical protein